MNALEREMVALLARLRERHHVSAVKAEFEAEGARLEEAMRLKDVASRAGLKLVIKVGGCEAVKDLYDAAALGADAVVAPMVESAYALSKFAQALGRAFPPDARSDLKAWINVETDLACRELDAMLDDPACGAIDGIVIGRGDLAGSLGLGRDVEHAAVRSRVLEAVARARSRGLAVIVGGGLTARSEGLAAEAGADGVETRKVVFDWPGAQTGFAAGIRLAHDFERLWLENKRAHYGRIHAEDEARLRAFEALYTG